MHNILTGKIWSLDTTTAISSAGIVTTTGVYIHSIRVRFTSATGAIGSCIITDCPNPGNYTSTMTILDLKTTAAATGVAYILDSQYTFGNQLFQGLMKTVCVNVETIYVVTCNPI